MRIPIILLLTCFLQVNALFGNGNVKLTFTFNGIEPNESIKIFLPIEGNANNQYVEDSNVMVIQPGVTYHKEFFLENPGIIFLDANSFGRITCYVRPNDILELVCTVSGWRRTCVFTGPNAAGHELLNNSLLENVQVGIYKIPLIDYNTDPVLTRFKKINRSAEHQIDSLLNNKSIEKDFRQFMIHEVESFGLYYLANRILMKSGGMEKRMKKGSQADSINHHKVGVLMRNIYEQYNPFDPKYVHCGFAGLNATDKGHFIIKNYENQDRTNLPTKLIWDGDQYQVYKNITYSPDFLQKHILGKYLIITLIYQFKDDMDIADAIKRYRKHFGSNEYTRIIEKLLPEYISNTKSPVNLNERTFRYDQTQSEKLILGYFGKPISDIRTLVQSLSSNKPVFVDVWATWCTPCKREFNYSHSLDSFLQKNNIDIIYLSIDKDGFYPTWKKDIVKYGLNGIHHFASEALVTSLEKELEEPSFLIPRYLLFDEKGELVLKDALRPSDKEELYAQILGKLKTTAAAANVESGSGFNLNNSASKVLHNPQK